MAQLFRLTSWIKEFLIGFCLGTANIIPGVSGGTFLLVFNIYERVFSILGNINKANILYLCKLLIKIVFSTDRPNELTRMGIFFKDNDFLFLIKLLIGAVVAIVAFSSLMKYLIVYQFSSTYALFFGLILVSIIIPVRMFSIKKLSLIFFVILGAALTIYVTWAVNPYEKVEKKSALYQAKYVESQATNKTVDPQVNKAAFNSNYTFDEYLYVFLCGAVAVSAMVLPGISGSLVLILMGEYFEVVSAISGLAVLNWGNIIFLGCFSLGIVLGGLFFAKLISAVLKLYYNATMAVLTGLMAGSLYALWPFKKSIVMAQQFVKIDGQINIVQNVRVYTNINELPKIDTQFYFSVVFFIIGCIIMSFFVKKESKR